MTGGMNIKNKKTEHVKETDEETGKKRRKKDK